MGKINYIIIKANGNCNLNCSYCYYTHHRLPQWEKAYNLELLELTFKKIAAYTHNVSICWHGGEPLLNGIDYYRNVLDLQQKYQICIEHNLQTNGTLINDEWAKFFKENNFSIGLSLDGDKAANDKHRHNKSKSSYNAVIQGLEKLKQNEVKFGVLCYANPEEDGVRIFHHFINLGIKKIDFMFPITSHNSDITINEDLLTDYFEKIFKAWLELNNPQVKIRLFEDIILLLVGGKAKNCIFKNQCNGFITIEPNGDVGICENNRINGHDNYLIGKNILYHDFNSIEKALDLKSASINTLHDSCLNCNLLNLCNGGCAVERFHHDYKNINVYCKIYKKLFANISKQIYSHSKI
ncbi:MAG: radical SAM protein [Bacteroidetes bacterium]|nr:radical SAM protein [Bacteroidota bacterium]